MSNVAEFIETRLQIESLVQQIALSMERKAIPQSKKALDEAAPLLAKLTAMADNDVQESAVGRLTRALPASEQRLRSCRAKLRQERNRRSFEKLRIPPASREANYL